jgi:hypothetical protein
MTFNVSYQPPNSTPRIEHYPTETAANNRAHFLVNGMRYHQVVVWEQDNIIDQGDAA